MREPVLISGSPQLRASAVAQTAVAGAAVILTANPLRKGFSVQNTGTAVIKLGLGSSPTATAYHVALTACSVADDATGGTYFDDAWVGDVWAISAGSTCVVMETQTGDPDWNAAGAIGNYGF